MTNCIFCKINNGEIPSKKVYENDLVFAINDINPRAPKHILVIPKNHIENFTDLVDENIARALYDAIKEIVKQENIVDYKLQINNGSKAGQEVMHLHIHILGY